MFLRNLDEKRRDPYRPTVRPGDILVASPRPRAKPPLTPEEKTAARPFSVKKPAMYATLRSIARRALRHRCGRQDLLPQGAERRTPLSDRASQVSSWRKTCPTKSGSLPDER